MTHSLANPDGRSGNYHASCFAPRLLLWGDFRTQEEIQGTPQSLLLFEPQKLRICFLFGFFGCEVKIELKLAFLSPFQALFGLGTWPLLGVVWSSQSRVLICGWVSA